MENEVEKTGDLKAACEQQLQTLRKLDNEYLDAYIDMYEQRLDELTYQRAWFLTCLKMANAELRSRGRKRP
jgi:hypothetical protein